MNSKSKIFKISHLKSVDVLSAVLKQAVIWVEHFMRKEIEPLPGHASIVQTLLPLELDHQSLSHVLGPHLDHLSVAVLKHLASCNFQPAVTRSRLEAAQLCLKDLHLCHEVPL